MATGLDNAVLNCKHKDLVTFLRVLASDTLPRQVSLGEEVVEDVGQSFQIVATRLFLALEKTNWSLVKR